MKQTREKSHSDVTPLPLWNDKSIKLTTRYQMLSLHLLETQATGHIVCNLSSCPPLVLLPQVMTDLCGVWMNRVSTIVHLTKYLLAQTPNYQDTNMT